MQGFRLYDYNKKVILKPKEDWMPLMTDRGIVLKFNSRTGDITPFPHRAMGIELQPLICYHEGRPLFAGDAVQLLGGKPDQYLELQYNEDTGDAVFVNNATGQIFKYDSIKAEITRVIDCVAYNRWKDEYK